MLNEIYPDPIGKNKQTVAKFYRAFNLHDSSLFDPLLDSDWKIHSSNNTIVREDWELGLLSLFEAFNDIQVTIEELVGEGEIVTARLTYRGTHTGQFLSLPASGLKVEFASQVQHRIKYDKIVETWQIEDWLSVLTMLKARSLY